MKILGNTDTYTIRRYSKHTPTQPDVYIRMYILVYIFLYPPHVFIYLADLVSDTDRHVSAIESKRFDAMR